MPVNGKPVSFNGAVGQFEIKADLEKNNFTTDETGKLTLEISGAGNLQLVTAPDIKWPSSLEVFDVKVTEDLLLLDVPVSGRKIFEIPFAVQGQGEYTIPAIEFSFFNPATGTYKTLFTKPISFTVQKGSATKPFYKTPPLVAKDSGSFLSTLFQNNILVVVGLGLFMALGLFILIKKANKKKDKNFVTNTTEAIVENEEAVHYAEAVAAEPQNPLQLSEDCLNTVECNEFYSLLNQELKTYLSHRFSVPVQEINVKKILIAMDRAGVDNEIALQTQQIIEEIEWQLYTPFERNELMNDLYNRTQSLLQFIQTYHLAPTL